ncbi:conserved hypothetical protein [Culex quinquefasciatus]|uniref:GYF domain-containing protein n=1 Tax=Culex quinquefasciatus TaxID=7176 RepID=B0W3B4_CULQU|nr:conserved hypothetical protein [Culex quinquefasciatus]|eukprot:XP_001843198.1 conserved hypothetical protein [Culex quinquefasciatus]
MGDAINFGPAWLRKGPGLGGGPPHTNNNNSISSGGGGAGAAAASTVTRYALAEFRYGREEMLALFDMKSVKSPEILANFKNLFVEKIQCPLALIPCTDDDVVPEPDSRRIWQSRSISLGVPGRGARGGSVDRGRGRGRGFLTGYQRSTSFYDDEARGVGRGERPWLERNGTGGGGGPLGGAGGVGVGGGGPGGPGGEVDWNSSSSSSPRKEFGVRARTANMDSWRRSRPDDEPSTTDWRSGSGTGGGGNGLSTSLSGSSLRDKWSRSTSWREEESGIGDGPGGRPLHSSSAGGGYKPRMSALSGGDLNTSGGPGGGLRRHWDADDQLPEWATENPSDYGGSFDASGAFHDSDNDIDGRLEDDGGKENHVDHRYHHQRKEGSQSNSRDGSVAKPSEAPSEAPEQSQPQHQHQHHQQIHHEPKKSASSSSVDRMQEVADDMVAQLIMDDEYTGSGVDSEPVPVVGPSRSLDKSPVLGGQIPLNLLLSSKDPVAMQQLFGGAGAANSRMLHGLGGGPQIPPPIPHPGTDIWYYRDPQGKVQGPFPASEMTEWYRAGYFDDSLSVRRACDEIYTNLGSLVALCGGAIPFLNSMNIPPIKANSSKQPQQPQPPQGPPASSFQQQQQQQQQQKQHLQQQQQQQPPHDSDLSAQFQFSKKFHLLRQQSLIMQKLASADGWQLLSQEQQNAIIAQHMAQLQLTDGVMISPTPGQNPAAAAAAANATNPPNPASIFGGGQPPQDSLVNLKQVQQQQGPGQPHPVLEQLQKQQSNSLSNAFQKMPDFGQPQPGGRPLLGNLNVDHTAAGHDHLGQLIHNINFNHQPPVQNLPGLGTNMLLKHNLMGSLTPQQQQQQQSQPPKPNQLENDPIQSLLMQLSMHKQQQQQQQQQQQPPPQPAKTPVEVMSPWLQNATMPPQQQQQQPGGRPLSSGWGDLAQPGGGQQSAGGPFGAHLGGHPLVNTSMANEPQAPSVVSLFKHHQQADKQQQQQQNQDKLVNDSQQQQMHQLPDDDQGEFINMKKEMEEKKRQKELKKQQQEEAKRKQLEEKKKLEELEAQKKAKLLEVQRREAQKIQEQQQQQQQQPAPRPVTKVAPWSASVAAETAVTGPSLAEIQKAERERRAALARQEQSLREQLQQQEMVELQTQLDSKLKWNSQTLPPQNIKSLAEIQAEEAAAAERNREKNAAAITAAAIAASSSKPSKKDDLLGTAVWQSQSGSGNSALTWNAAKLWAGSEDQNSNSVSSGGFWEEPNPSNKNAGRQKHHQQHQQQQQQQQQQQAQNQKQLLAKSKTMGSISTASSSNAVAAAKQHQQKQQQQQQQQQQLAAKRAASASANKNATPAAGNGKERSGGGGGVVAAQNAGSADQTTHEFTGWCTRALTSLGSNVDIPTFVGFLQDIESPFEVKDYIRLYLGETKDCAEFAKQFLERRSKYKNQMRQKNAHIDDMCKPAPAINPSSNDFQEIKGKNKKIKKNKMTKLDNRILGFSVTAAPDRLNVGDRDYGDNA